MLVTHLITFSELSLAVSEVGDYVKQYNEQIQEKNTLLYPLVAMGKLTEINDI